MIPYQLFTLDGNGKPREIRFERNAEMRHLKEYKKNLELYNPGKIYWIYDNTTGDVLF